MADYSLELILWIDRLEVVSQLWYSLIEDRELARVLLILYTGSYFLCEGGIGFMLEDWVVLYR
jgi:hypothetical protein